jgi:glycosyltransferase involved in cell wall biosynthesis
MIIAHVLSSFGLGGQERMAAELVAGQVAKGHEVLAISLAAEPEGPLAAEFRGAGAATLGLPKRGSGIDLSLFLRLSELLKRQGVQIVHTHNPQPLVYAALAAKLSRSAVVHTKHGNNPARGRRLLLRRVAASFVDAYVAVSKATADVALRRRECSPDRLTVIPNGVDVERYRRTERRRNEVRAELGLPDSAVVIGSVGRLAPEKNYGLLVDAAAPILGPHVYLVLAGDGPERRALEARIERRGVQHFTRLIGVRNDVCRLMSAFDVFVLSSTTEGLPLVVPEAMAASLPIVSTAVGGIPDVVEHGVTGLLCSPGNEAALRGCLTEIAASPARSRALGDAAHRVAVETYGRERMLRSYLSLYSDLLTHHRRSGVTASCFAHLLARPERAAEPTVRAAR